MTPWISFGRPAAPTSAWVRSRRGAGRRRGALAIAQRAAAGGLLTLVVGGAAVLPGPIRALAAPGTANGDLSVLAGPGTEYTQLSTAPVGTAVSVDGAAVDGYYPVTVDGVSGWVPEWAVSVDSSTTDPVLATDPMSGGAPAATVDGVPVEGAGADPSAAGWTDPATGEWVEPAPQAQDQWTEPAPVDQTTDWTEPAPVAAAPDAAAPVEAAPVEAAAAPSGGATERPRGLGGGNGYSEDEIVGIITDAARAYGQSPEAMLRVARCESNLDPNAVGSGIYFGLFQFVPSTFEGTPFGGYDIFDPWANANAAAWMWSEGRKYEWVCQ